MNDLLRKLSKINEEGYWTKTEEEQIDNSEIISLVPTDTAIKGNVKLFSKAIVLIGKDRYNSLSIQEKEQLERVGFSVQVFDGELKEAVNET